MGKLKNLFAGLCGAVALNILHESLKHKRNTPRIDLLGEQALQKTVRHLGGNITDEQALYNATLAGDIISNTLYYSMIGSKKQSNIWLKAITMGLLAGVGAVKLPEPMGLNEKPVAKTKTISAMTVGYYLFGALVTAAVLTVSRRK
ncbi:MULTISPECIES: hypothetical protein [Pedobacter]|uniref:hypothetical protein n=1 Tax=Pedobacter TaxID=84567 RepID=UPI00210A6290|nr:MULTISPECIES: hypothetical protein [unclassified Pedobacter]